MKNLFILILLLSSFLTACNESEPNLTNIYRGCLVSVVERNGISGYQKTNFDYNRKAELNEIFEIYVPYKIAYKNDKVTLTFGTQSIQEFLFWENGKWIYSTKRNETFMYPHVSVFTSTPTYTDSLITKITSIYSVERVINNIKYFEYVDTTISELNYNAKGNLISLNKLSKYGNTSFTFDYADSTASVNSNSYFNHSLLSKLGIDNIFLPYILGKFIPFQNPPSRVNIVGSSEPKYLLQGIYSDPYNRLIRIITKPSVPNTGTGSDTLKFGYRCW